jgi:hypothetical protein
MFKQQLELKELVLDFSGAHSWLNDNVALSAFATSDSGARDRILLHSL